MLIMGGKTRNSSLNVLLILELPEVTIFLQEIYLEYLFMPGRFTNAAIQKALQVSEREFGMLSVHPLPGPLDVRQQDFLELLPGMFSWGLPGVSWWLLGCAAAAVCPQLEMEPGIRIIGFFPLG